MPCRPELLKDIPLFALLDDDEAALLASQVDHRTFAVHERIYREGDPGGPAYVLLSGKVRVSAIDEDQQEVIVDEPGQGEFFGLASMLQQTPHQTTAFALEESACLQISRDDIQFLLERKPHAGMDLLTTTSRHFHSAEHLVRTRACRNPNEVIEKETTRGERTADLVAKFGGSWSFILLFAILTTIYAAINVVLDKKAWDPYPFILLNLFLSMLAAVQAPVIMMSQNRQDSKDRLRGELDFEVNRRAESEIKGLASKLHLLDEKIDHLGSLIRKKESSPLR
jgi:CRP/FNR family transcriptional regulator, cyclic AMP receptor protein